MNHNFCLFNDNREVYKYKTECKKAKLMKDFDYTESDTQNGINRYCCCKMRNLFNDWILNRKNNLCPSTILSTNGWGTALNTKEKCLSSYYSGLLYYLSSLLRRVCLLNLVEWDCHSCLLNKQGEVRVSNNIRMWSLSFQNFNKYNHLLFI